MIVFVFLQAFKNKPEHFPGFFREALKYALEKSDKISFIEQKSILVFLIHCFNSVVSVNNVTFMFRLIYTFIDTVFMFSFPQEVDLIREQIQRLVSLPMWMCLLEVLLFN